MLGIRVSHLGPKCVDERCSTENTARKCGVFCIFNAVSRREKFEKTLFPENQFFHAREDISEMQRNSFMVWCDSNTKAEKQRKPAAAVPPAPLLACEVAACPIRWESDTQSEVGAIT